MADKLKKKSGKPPEPDSPWKARLTRMKKYQQRAAKNWDRNKKLIFGETDKQDAKGNLFSFGWGLVKALETTIYVHNPEMIVEPYDGQKMEMGHLLTNIANYDIDQMDLKSIGNLGLVDCFINGFFCCIETIETETETVRYPSGDEDIRSEDQRFCAYRVPPKDFLVDPKARKLDLSDADYCAVAFYPTITAIKADKKTFQSVPSDIEDYPESSPEKPPTPQYGSTRGNLDTTSQGETDPEYKTICVWEIHDKVKQEIIYVTDHKTKEIGRIDWPVKYKVGGRTLFPITLMAFHSVPDVFWPKPEIDLIAPQLENINRLDQAIITDALEKWRVFVTLVGLLRTDQAAKITEMNGSNQLIQVDMDDVKELAGGQPPTQYPNVRDLVGVLEDPQVKRDQLAVRDMLMQEITDIVGYGPPQRGGMPVTRSAREAVAIKERTDARLASRADAVANFYRLFGQKHIMALQQKAVVDRYVRVWDAAKNLAQFQQYSKSDIECGLFNFIVYAGTSMPRNTESKRNSEIQLYQALLPGMQAGQIPWQPPLLRLAEAFQWKGVDALLRNFRPATAMLAKTLFAMQQQKGVQPQALLEASAAVVQAVLTPEELQLIQKELAGPGAGGGGALPAMASPGQRGESDASKAAVPS
jgi:hypothetical protein